MIAKIRGELVDVEIIKSRLWYRLIEYESNRYNPQTGKMLWRETRGKWLPKWRIYDEPK